MTYKNFTSRRKGRGEVREEEEETEKRDIPIRLEHLDFFCCDYRRGISETKKVSHHIASRIPVFALLPSPSFLLSVFLRLGESLVSRLQRFSASLLSHPHRDSFFFPSHLTAAVEIPLSFSRLL